jgi:hypothetical protein
MVGRARAERVISVSRGGGDLSAPDADPYAAIVLDEHENQHEQVGRTNP